MIATGVATTRPLPPSQGWNSRTISDVWAFREIAGVDASGSAMATATSVSPSTVGRAELLSEGPR